MNTGLRFWTIGAIYFFLTCGAAPGVAQTKGPTTANPAPVTADYPQDRAGILIYSSEWVPLKMQAPTKTRTKHGIAPALTYGVAPTAVVSIYDGLHAAEQVEPGQPMICICHLLDLPGDPIIVRLHPKKTYRELDGGNLHIRSKAAEAVASDLIPVTVTKPESNIWLVQPQERLPEGEYALMAGTQNLAIYPFSVAASAPAENH